MIFIKSGIYATIDENGKEEDHLASICIYAEGIKILDEEDDFIAQLTYEELRGIMAMIEALREKKGIEIIAKSKEN